MAPEVRDTLLIIGSIMAVLLGGVVVGCAILFVVIAEVDQLVEQIGEVLACLIREVQVAW